VDEVAWKIENGPFTDAAEIERLVCEQDPEGVVLTHPEEREHFRCGPLYDFSNDELAYHYDSDFIIGIYTNEPDLHALVPVWLHARPYFGYPPVVYLRYQDSRDFRAEVQILSPWSEAETRHQTLRNQRPDAHVSDTVLEKLNALADDLMGLSGQELENTADLLWWNELEGRAQTFNREWTEDAFNRGAIDYEPQHLQELFEAFMVILEMEPGSDVRVLTETLYGDWVGSAWGLFRLVEATLGVDMRNVLARCPVPIWIKDPDQYPNVDPVTGKTS